MRYEDVENLLRCYKPIMARINVLRTEVTSLTIQGRMEGLDETAAGLALMRAPMTGMPYPPEGNITDKTPRVAGAYAKLNVEDYRNTTKELFGEIYRLEAIRDKIDHALEGLQKADKMIVAMFYIEGHTWAEIVRATKYAPRWCREKRKAAVDRLMSILRISDDEIFYLKELQLWPAA